MNSLYKLWIRVFSKDIEQLNERLERIEETINHMRQEQRILYESLDEYMVEKGVH